MNKQFWLLLQFCMVTDNTILICFYLRDSIGHPVRSESPHHAQFLEGGLVFPFLGELLLLRALTFHKLLPSFGRAFNVSVQVPELLHVGHCLKTGKGNQIYGIFIRFYKTRLQDSSLLAFEILQIYKSVVTLIPPQLLLLMKSTGLVTLGTAGKRSRKSSSIGLMSFAAIRI